ncbi:hypothetical protein ACFQE1_03145 [Halobium palmae]|uniref:RelE toxin-related domain-containing protein n=1 Tax=Halobium palmae TaxID=1776492 RepID=A0ABD5RVD5_9EURY
MSASMPQPTHHSDLRLVMRAGPFAPSVRDTWTDAEPVDVEGYVYDQARYNDVYDIVLLARDGAIVTAIRGQYTELTTEDTALEASR